MSELSIGKPCRKFVNPDRGDPQTFYIERSALSYDWTLISSDDVKFRIHSSALVSQSDYFAALCASGMSEQQNNTVKFPDIDSVALERFLSYTCTGSVVVGADSFFSLVQLGSRFQCQSLIDILKRYLELEFLNITQNDVSELFTTRIHPGLADIAGRLIGKHLVSERMLGLSFNAVASMLRRDDLESSCEDRVLKFVEEYCDRWELDAERRVELLEGVRQPRLTCRAFEKAAIFLREIKSTKSFETVSNSRLHRHQFIEEVDEDQLRPRAGNDVHITMLWIMQKESTSMSRRNGVSVSVRPLCAKAQRVSQPVTIADILCREPWFSWENQIFDATAFVAYANHVYCINPKLRLNKITFKEEGPLLTATTDRKIRGRLRTSEDFVPSQLVIGVDVDQDSFFLSCRGPRRLSVFKCEILSDHALTKKRVQLPPSVENVGATRMIYREDFICILTFDAEILIYATDSDTLRHLSPADSSKPKYLQIARRENKLYVFDYSKCPAHLHDFSQPFSHFDKIRVYDLAQKKWEAHYPVEMNKLRQSGYNELIALKIDLYFIREQLYILWRYQDRLQIFRLDEEAGCTEHLFNYEVPSKADGVILLPGYFHLHNDSTMLESFLNGYCLKNLEFVWEHRVNARHVAEWHEKYFGGIVGSGVIPFYPRPHAIR